MYTLIETANIVFVKLGQGYDVKNFIKSAYIAVFLY
jgi:hypothetical protein